MNYLESDVEALLRSAAWPKTGPVPASVSNRIEAVLEGLRERPAPRSRARLRPLAAVGAAGLALAVVAGLAERGGFIGQPGSPAVPMRVVGEVMPEADRLTGPSVTDQGITVMVRDVVYDSNDLGLRYTVTSDRPLDFFRADAELLLDGRSLGYVGSEYEGEQGRFPLANRYQRTDDGSYEGVILAPVASSWGAQTMASPSGNTLSLVAGSVQLRIRQIGGVAGDWSFDIPISAEPGRTVSGYVDRTSVYGTFHVDRAVVSPVSMQATIGFAAGDLGSMGQVGVEIADDTGHLYGDAVLSSLAATINLPPLSAEAKSLVFRPYAFARGGSEDVPELFRTAMTERPTEREPLKLPLGEAGTLEVTGIDYLPDRTIVHTRPDYYARGFMLLDDQGRSIDPLSWDAGDGAQFEPVSPDAKLVFVTSAEPKRTYIPELEIRIDLPRDR